jgi:hypothetical protein
MMAGMTVSEIGRRTGLGSLLFLVIWVCGGVGLLVWWLYERSKSKKKKEQ